jgi:hypothetical protein
VPDQQLREWMIGKTNEEFCQFAGRPVAQARARRMVFEKAVAPAMVEWAESHQDRRDGAALYAPDIPRLRCGEFQEVIIYVVRITEKRNSRRK